MILTLYGLTAPLFVQDGGDAPIPPLAYEASAANAPIPHILDRNVWPPSPAAAAIAQASTKPVTVSASAAVPASLVSSLEKDISSYLDTGVKARKVKISRGDTLLGLLVNKASVPPEDAQKVITALKKVYDPRALNPGREITVFFHQNPAEADPRFSGLRLDKDLLNTVTVNRGDDGDYTVSKAEKDVHRTLRGFKGTISNSLYEDAAAQGVPDAVILELIKMYSWNVDFQRGIHEGDKFEVMYEEYKTEDDKRVPGRGNITYAKLTLDGQAMPFYRYESKGGDVGYYDDEGRSARKPLMKTPVDGARISSGYGMRRHPVLGYSKMHKGVDFAVPMGTPIYAAGDGVIEKIGPFSSYGNYVRIRHANGLKTAYGHMRGFKAGLRSGSRVKQGQVIGYVGMTGRATGPHVHYEILVNNTQVNPGSVKLPTGTALKGKELKSFKGLVAGAQQNFESLVRGSKSNVASR